MTLPSRFSLLRTAAPWLALIVFYTAVTLWMTRPVVQFADRAVAGYPGDNLFHVWLLDWYHQSIVNLRWPLDVPVLNAPEGWNLAYNELTYTIMLGLPGYLFGGPALAYNVRFWLSFILSGLFVAIWVWRLTRRMAPAAVAGLIFAFVPYRLSHAYGHLNLLGTEWLPLYFMCVTEMLRGGSWRWSAGAAVSLALLASTTQYYLFMSAVLSIVFALVTFSLRPASFFDRKVWKSVLLGVALALPLVALIVWPYLALALQGTIVFHSAQEVSMWSASPTDFLLPTPVNWLLGKWVDAHFDRHLWLESTVAIGVIPLALAIGAWRTAKREPAEASLAARTLAIVAVIAFVLALGTHLHWLGREVHVPVPAFLRGLADAELVPVLMPGYLLFKFLPFYSGMRVWMRWGIYVNMLVAVLAGLGFARVTRGRSRVFSALGFVLVCGLVLAEFAQTPYPVTRVRARAADAWLARQTDKDLMIQLPADQLGGGPAMAQTIFHEHPYVGAAFSPFPTPQYLRIAPSLSRFPAPASVETMRSLGVRWVFVDLTRYPPSIKDDAAAAGLTPVIELDGQLIMELR